MASSRTTFHFFLPKELVFAKIDTLANFHSKYLRAIKGKLEIKKIMGVTLVT